jgi:hypothetical protein
MRKTPVVLSLTVLALAAAVVIALLFGEWRILPSAEGSASEDSSDREAVAAINGEGVEAGEIGLYLGAARAAVIEYFRTQYGLDYGPDFWTQPHEIEQPLDRLTQELTREAVPVLLLRELAQEAGVASEPGFAVMMADMEKENAERNKRAERGEPVYGPVQYQALTYYFERMGGLADRVRQALREQWSPTDAELREHYEEMREDYFRSGEAALLVVSVPKGAAVDLVEADRIYELLVSRDPRTSWEARTLLEEAGFAEAVVQESVYQLPPTREQLPDYTLFVRDTLQAGAGTWTKSSKGQESVVMAVALEKPGFRYADYESVRNQVAGHYLEQRVDQWIAERAASAELNIDKKWLEKAVD